MNSLAIIRANPALMLAALVMFALGMMNASVAPYASLVAIERVGISRHGYSIVLVISSAVAVTSAVLFGVLGDQSGHRRSVAMVTAAASALGVGLMVAAPSVLAVIMCHALLFPLGSSLYGQTFALARLAAPQKDGMADAVLGAIRSAMSISFMLMLAFWTYAFAAGVDVMWVYTTALPASLLIVALIAARWPRKGKTPWQDRPSGLNLRAALTELARPHVSVRLFLLGAINVCGMLYFVLISLLFDASPLRDASDVALYVGAVAAVEIPCLILLPRLVGRISRSTLIAIGGGFYALHLVLMPFWMDTQWVWLGAAIAGIGGTAIIALPITYYQNLLVGRPGAASAMLALQRLVSDVLGASAFAIGISFGGYQTVAILGFAITIFGALGLFLADRHRFLLPQGPAAS